MTDLEKVARMALKTLEYIDLQDHDRDFLNYKECHDLDEAITALHQALSNSVEQPAQQSAERGEPVVWMYQNKSTHEVSFQKHMRSFVDHGAWYEVPLYSEPLANQEKTSGSPKPAKPEALRLADAMEYDLDWCDEAAAELRRMHDLLGKANALCRIRAEEIERLKAQPEQEPVAWCPDVCPITGLPFFMWIEHHETGQMVPTYGGPYDSYTIPVRDKDGGYCRERYDHDRGGWLTDEVEDVGIQIVSDQAYVSDEPPASKPWVGLTNKEWQDIVDDPKLDNIGAVKTAIEAKLKEKNA